MEATPGEPCPCCNQVVPFRCQRCCDMGYRSCWNENGHHKTPCNCWAGQQFVERQDMKKCDEKA